MSECNIPEVIWIFFIFFILCRRARAETEAHLLTDLQKELSRLDNLLTTDVSIIRDRIETASLEYTESQ